jgi:hypothetical protein
VNFGSCIVGGRRERAVVVTVTVAEPLLREGGLMEQCVAVAAKEQETLTAAEKPLAGVTVTALMNVAVEPALTVWVVVPELMIEKSGGGGAVRVKFTGTDVPPGAGSTMYKGNVPIEEPAVMVAVS